MTPHPDSRSAAVDKSTDTSQKTMSGAFQIDLNLQSASGTLQDAEVVRHVLTEALRECGKSRAQVADEMSALTGRPITERMLNRYASESRGDCLFPAELERAFCIATGNDRLLRCKAELHGLHVIDAKDAELVELGRAFLQRTQAEETIALLERRLHGRQR